MAVWIASLALVVALACAVRQTIAADYPMYLDTAVTHMNDSGYMRLELQYLAKPGNVVSWQYPAYSYVKDEVVQGSPNGSGQFWYTASLEFDVKGERKQKYNVYTYLSDQSPADVNVSIIWSPSYGERTHKLDHYVVAISPGLDLVYDDGAGPTQVTMEVPADDRGRPDWASGYFVDAPKSPLKVLKNNLEIKEESITKDGSTIFTFTFPTNEQPINGIFQGVRWMTYWDDDVAVFDIGDSFVVSVHHRENAGPFPERHGYAIWEHINYPTTCTLEYTCKLFCVVFGNQIDGIDFYMEKADGEKREVPGTTTSQLSPYHQVITAPIDSSSTDAKWTYTCRPVIKDAQWVQEARVNVTIVEFASG